MTELCHPKCYGKFLLFPLNSRYDFSESLNQPFIHTKLKSVNLIKDD